MTTNSASETAVFPNFTTEQLIEAVAIAKADGFYEGDNNYSKMEAEIERREKVATAPKTDYEAGYRAFSEDPDGAIARAVADHFSGKMRMDSLKYSDDWHTGYQDATDDFSNAQSGGE